MCVFVFVRACVLFIIYCHFLFWPVFLLFYFFQSENFFLTNKQHFWFSSCLFVIHLYLYIIIMIIWETTTETNREKKIKKKTCGLLLVLFLSCVVNCGNSLWRLCSYRDCGVHRQKKKRICTCFLIFIIILFMIWIISVV